MFDTCRPDESKEDCATFQDFLSANPRAVVYFVDPRSSVQPSAGRLARTAHLSAHAQKQNDGRALGIVDLSRNPELYRKAKKVFSMRRVDAREDSNLALAYRFDELYPNFAVRYEFNGGKRDPRATTKIIAPEHPLDRRPYTFDLPPSEAYASYALDDEMLQMLYKRIEILVAVYSMMSSLEVEDAFPKTQARMMRSSCSKRGRVTSRRQ